MSRVILKWHFNKLVKMIVAVLLNKFDCFMVIEGNTGTGKSTIAFEIALKISQEFKRLYKLDEETVEYYYERVGRKAGLTEDEFIEKILKLKEKKSYIFHPRKALIYTQDELLSFLASWNSLSIPDELINTCFNRDFYSDKQKDIIKMISMFRDHENLTIGCCPQFQSLDVQVKNLTKIKITVKKRGIAIIHTPNPVIYCKDKWDQATNEKIEREWIAKKITHPNYSKLTTFRGLIKFPPLSKKQEAMYQKIKDAKRTVVVRDEMHIQMKDEDTPFGKFMKRLLDGSIRNGFTVDGYAEGMGVTSVQLRSKVVNELRRLGKPTALSYFFWDKKYKNKEETQEFEGI